LPPAMVCVPAAVRKEANFAGLAHPPVCHAEVVAADPLPCPASPLPAYLLQEKEDWINAVGRAIVRHSKR